MIKPEKSSKASKSFPLYNQLFRDVYAIIEHAIELIREMLSELEFALFDWTQIRLEKESFTKGLECDLLFTVPLKLLPFIRMPFFILFEHKSIYTPRVLIQVLSYMTEVIGRYSQQEKRAVMPPLIGILFVHGTKNVKSPLRLQDILPQQWQELQAKEQGKGPFSDLSKDMLNYGLRAYNVHDPKFSDHFKNWQTRIALYLFRDKEFLTSEDERALEEGLVNLLKELKGVRNQDTLLSAIQFHLLKRNPKITLDFFNRCLRLASDKDETLIKVKGGKMGAYIPMIERGRLEGRQEGIQEGRQEGIQEIISHLLKANMDVQQICKMTRLSKEEVLQIQKQCK